MKRYFLSILVTACLCLNSPLLLYGGFDDTVKDIQKKLNCSQNDAMNFMKYVKHTMEKIQNNLSLIALIETPKGEKNELIKFTISEYFEKPTSMIYTSSKTQSGLEKVTVKYYLDKLANSYYGRYTKVELYFRPDYLKMGAIQAYIDPKYGKAYEFTMDTWQIFKGYIGDNIVYEDATLKVFGFIFFKSNNDDIWALKIRSVSVKHTTTVEELKTIFR